MFKLIFYPEMQTPSYQGTTNITEPKNTVCFWEISTVSFLNLEHYTLTEAKALRIPFHSNLQFRNCSSNISGGLGWEVLVYY